MRRALVFVALAACLYIAVAAVRFRFINPALTETELFISLPDALAWRDAP